MRSSFGGTQPDMHDSKMVEGCLGPHGPTLALGNMQQFSFRDTDDGPFWMSPAQRELKKTDKPKGTSKKRALRKGELLLKLRAKGVEPPRRFLPKAEVQELAQSHNIETEIHEAEMEPGWVGRPKGLRQVLWERGLLDPLQSYTVDGPKDADGMADPTRSYKILMSNLHGFQNRKDGTTKSWRLTGCCRWGHSKVSCGACGGRN
jgi:hypothetical protein